MYNVEEFKAIINKPSFKKTFAAIEGEKLSRPPKDFPADFPDIDLLKFKSYTVMHSVDNDTMIKPDFEKYIFRVFKEMNSLNKFLNKALT
jgi:uncharacterized protein (DUF2461 family)